jgi:hypothetical protein
MAQQSICRIPILWSVALISGIANRTFDCAVGSIKFAICYYINSCLFRSVSKTHRGEIPVEGPHGESAEALMVVDVELRQPLVTGTKIADDLAARGYDGP